MGADDAIHVEIADGSLGGPLEPLGVSKILSAIVEKEKESEEIGLVIMGKQAIDDDASQTGQMLAAMLDWPQATFASKLEFLGKLEKGEKVRVTREVDGGLGVVETTLPFVMTTDLRLNGECIVCLSVHLTLALDCLPRTAFRTTLRLVAKHHEGKEEAIQEAESQGFGFGRGRKAEAGDCGRQGATKERRRRQGGVRG